MRKLIPLCSLLALGLVTGCSLSDDASHTHAQTIPNAGGLQIALLAVSSVQVSEVHYKIAIPERGALEGTLPVAADGTISGVVSEVPASADVLVSLSAATRDGGTCSGEGTVTVVAGETTGVSIVLQCRLPNGTPVTTGSIEINGTLNVCPQVTAAAADPASTESSSALTSSATDLDGDMLTSAWSATSGSFADPSAANTSYTCASSGEQTLTVTVDDGRGCTHAKTVTVTCSAVTPPAPSAVCGNGAQEGSEGCDDGNTTAGDGCSATCTIEEPPPPPARDDLSCDQPRPIADACAECTCASCGTQVAACTSVTGDASEGPGSGQSKAALCKALVACGQRTQCRGTTCFCGAADLVSCLTGGAAGPCMNEVLAAAETSDPAVVATRQTDTNFAVGLANAVSSCTVSSCEASCGAASSSGS
jgi:cysteine-rich repeat protein